jgi:DNA repair protein RadC
MLRAARTATPKAVRSEMADRAITPSDPKLIQYLKTSLGSLPHEILRVLFLNGSRQMIADEQMRLGTIGQLTEHARVIFRRALELNAAAIILVHNHPSGDPSPSSADIAASERLVAIGRSLDVDMLEHIIVTTSEHRSILRDRSAGPPPSPVIFRDDMVKQDDRSRALANARKSWRRRLLRRQLVGSDELFGEPAWDMLVDLLIHEGEARPVSTSSCCIVSGLPTTSARRLLQRLCDAGLVTTEADRDDGRRTLIRLSSDLAHRLTAYFAEGEE